MSQAHAEPLAANGTKSTISSFHRAKMRIFHEDPNPKSLMNWTQSKTTTILSFRSILVYKRPRALETCSGERTGRFFWRFGAAAVQPSSSPEKLNPESFSAAAAATAAATAISKAKRSEMSAEGSGNAEYGRVVGSTRLPITRDT